MQQTRVNTPEQKQMWRFACSMRYCMRYEQTHGTPAPTDPRLIPGRKNAPEYISKAEKRYFREKRFVMAYDQARPGAIMRQIEFDRIKAEHHRLSGVEVF